MQISSGVLTFFYTAGAFDRAFDDTEDVLFTAAVAADIDQETTGGAETGYTIYYYACDAACIYVTVHAKRYDKLAKIFFQIAVDFAFIDPSASSLQI